MNFFGKIKRQELGGSKNRVKSFRMVICETAEKYQEIERQNSIKVQFYICKVIRNIYSTNKPPVCVCKSYKKFLQKSYKNPKWTNCIL